MLPRINENTFGGTFSECWKILIELLKLLLRRQDPLIKI
jgi:hypothetical protein